MFFSDLKILLYEISLLVGEAVCKMDVYEKILNGFQYRIFWHNYIGRVYLYNEAIGKI